MKQEKYGRVVSVGSTPAPSTGCWVTSTYDVVVEVDDAKLTIQVPQVFDPSDVIRHGRVRLVLEIEKEVGDGA